jgi:hypothetical protein
MGEGSNAPAPGQGRATATEHTAAATATPKHTAAATTTTTKHTATAAATATEHAAATTTTTTTTTAAAENAARRRTVHAARRRTIHAAATAAAAAGQHGPSALAPKHRRGCRRAGAASHPPPAPRGVREWAPVALVAVAPQEELARLPAATTGAPSGTPSGTPPKRASTAATATTTAAATNAATKHTGSAAATTAAKKVATPTDHATGSDWGAEGAVRRSPKHAGCHAPTPASSPKHSCSATPKHAATTTTATAAATTKHTAASTTKHAAAPSPAKYTAGPAAAAATTKHTTTEAAAAAKHAPSWGVLPHTLAAATTTTTTTTTAAAATTKRPLWVRERALRAFLARALQEEPARLTVAPAAAPAAAAHASPLRIGGRCTRAHSTIDSACSQLFTNAGVTANTGFRTPAPTPTVFQARLGEVLRLQGARRQSSLCHRLAANATAAPYRSPCPRAVFSPDFAFRVCPRCSARSVDALYLCALVCVGDVVWLACAGGQTMDALRSKVKAQGEKIRIMKRDGAAPEEITREVATLALYKEELKVAAEAAEVSVDVEASAGRWRAHPSTTLAPPCLPSPAHPLCVTLPLIPA